MKKSLILFATSLLALAGCTRNQEIDIQESGLSLLARTESPAETKTVVESGTHVFWEPGDDIAVFMGVNSTKFTTDITAASGTAIFKGSFGEDAWPDDLDLWALYPYNANATFDGECITTVLPSEQVARAGSFGKDMNVAIARTTTPSLQFYNVCGGAVFTVAHEGIQSVTFKSNYEEALSGTIRVGFNPEGIPEIKEIVDGMDHVTVQAPEGGFVPGVRYFAVFLHGLFEEGLTVSYKSSCHSSTFVLFNPLTVNRSRFGVLERKDEDLDFEIHTGLYPATKIPNAVDLGLSVKWASFNLGAEEPEEYGDYFAWGETEPYYTWDEFDHSLIWKAGKEAGYDYSSYKWCMGSEYSMTKYCLLSYPGYEGFIDGRRYLEPQDDAAHVNLGGRWRMPKHSEIAELVDNCTWTWITQNGVNGRLVTSNINGNSIFFPATGFRQGTDLYFANDGGDYWISDTLPYDTANELLFNEFDVIIGMGLGRIIGCPVRPVYAE